MKKETSMNHSEKAAVIGRWIDPEERITVQFDDQQDKSWAQPILV